MWRLRNALYLATKRFTAAAGDRYLLLRQSYLVAHFRGQRLEHETLDMWLHFGLHIASPYRICFHGIEVVDILPDGLPPDPARLHITSLGWAKSEFFALEPLLQRDKWDIMWYKLESTHRPIQRCSC